MKMYSDKELKNEISYIDFGTVEAGTKKRITIYLLNDSEAILNNLIFDFPVEFLEQLEIISFPQRIDPSKTGELVLEWKPSKEFKKALQVPITIKAEEIYLAQVAV